MVVLPDPCARACDRRAPSSRRALDRRRRPGRGRARAEGVRLRRRGRRRAADPRAGGGCGRGPRAASRLGERRGHLAEDKGARLCRGGRRPRARRQPQGVDPRLLGRLRAAPRRRCGRRDRQRLLDRGDRRLPDAVAYEASKGGIDALTRQVAVDYGAAGIRCNGVRLGRSRRRSPTSTSTPTAKTGRRCSSPGATSARSGLVGEPEDVAAVIAFLPLRRRSLRVRGARERRRRCHGALLRYAPAPDIGGSA